MKSLFWKCKIRVGWCCKKIKRAKEIWVRSKTWIFYLFNYCVHLVLPWFLTARNKGALLLHILSFKDLLVKSKHGSNHGLSGGDQKRRPCRNFGCWSAVRKGKDFVLGFALYSTTFLIPITYDGINHFENYFKWICDINWTW